MSISKTMQENVCLKNRQWVTKNCKNCHRFLKTQFSIAKSILEQFLHKLRKIHGFTWKKSSTHFECTTVVEQAKLPLSLHRSLFGQPRGFRKSGAKFPQGEHQNVFSLPSSFSHFKHLHTTGIWLKNFCRRRMVIEIGVNLRALGSWREVANFCRNWFDCSFLWSFEL